jgi:hypothetical protein
MNKFGVNCYGFKPEGNVKFPVPAPGVDHTEFQKAVDEIKPSMKSFTVSPWSRLQWRYGTQFTQPLGKLTEGFTEYLNEFSETVASDSSTTAAAVGAPYGLQGARGPRGPIGPAGPAGRPGMDSTVPGPAGVAGEMGPTGMQGPAGPMGPTGAATSDLQFRQMAIRGLVSGGSINNFRRCMMDSKVLEIAKSMPVPSESDFSSFPVTKRSMCLPYYTDARTDLTNDGRDTRRTNPQFGDLFF